MEPDIPAGIAKYLSPSAKDHGHDGQVFLPLFISAITAAKSIQGRGTDRDMSRPVKVGFPKAWEKGHQAIVDIWAASGVIFSLFRAPLS